MAPRVLGAHGWGCFLRRSLVGRPGRGICIPALAHVSEAPPDGSSRQVVRVAS